MQAAEGHLDKILGGGYIEQADSCFSDTTLIIYLMPTIPRCYRGWSGEVNEQGIVPPVATDQGESTQSGLPCVSAGQDVGQREDHGHGHVVVMDDNMYYRR